jgi:ribosomal 50S subunit-associated protein YjgA (DUF615 family)
VSISENKEDDEEIKKLSAEIKTLSQEDLEKSMLDRFYATLLIVNKTKYGPLLTMFVSQYSMGQDQ